MKIKRDDVKGALKGAAVVELGGRELRRGERLPADLPEDVKEGVLLRDERGNLTYAGMCRAVEQGGSVLYQGVIISNKDDLPDEADVAKGDQLAVETLRASIAAQQAALAQQMAKLDEGMPQPPPSPAIGQGNEKVLAAPDDPHQRAVEGKEPGAAQLEEPKPETKETPPSPEEPPATPEETAPEPAEPAEPAEPEDDGLEEMTVAELRELAEREGAPWQWEMRKEALVRTIRTARNERG